MPKDLLFDWWVKSEGYVEQTGTQGRFPAFWSRASAV